MQFSFISGSELLCKISAHLDDSDDDAKNVSDDD